MRLHVLTIGRLRDVAIEALLETYRGRTPWSVSWREIQPRGRAAGVESESRALLDSVPKGARKIALDESGRDLTSREIAARLGGWQDEGIADVAFLIGGADGLSADARDAADVVLAFGRATWPHMLVRPMLAEQIYRASAILAGHPYHRD